MTSAPVNIANRSAPRAADGRHGLVLLPLGVCCR